MIYDNVKKQCKKKKISLSELEKRAGLGNGTITKWRDCSPKVDNLKAVASVLGVSINTLLKEGD